MKFVVKRDKWLRGKGSSFLSNDEGDMCCLGFLALALGHTPYDIIGTTTPAGLSHKKMFPTSLSNLSPKGFSGSANTEHCKTIMLINDSKDIPDRERKLTELFKAIDIDVEFI